MRDIQGNDPSLTSFADLGSKKGAIIYLNFTLQSYSLKEYKLSELVQQSLNGRRSWICPLFSFLGQIEKGLSSGVHWLWTCLLLQAGAIQDWGGRVLREKNNWLVDLFKTSNGFEVRVILKGIWKNNIHYMYVRSLLTPWNSIVTKSLNVVLCIEKVPWSRSRGGGRALSGYLLDHRQPLH